MKEVTEVEGLKNLIRNTAFEEMIFSIRRDDYMEVILQLRRIYASGDKSAYEKAKKALRAFTPSGTFKGRRLLEFMMSYSYIIVLDFDKLSPSELIRVKEVVCQCPFTVACFVSPTGNGLKVFVCVKSGPEKHLQAFLSIQKYYTKLTGVEIDASGKDITRLCFVSWDPKLYYNTVAKVFDWEVKGSDDDNVGRPLVGLQGSNEDIKNAKGDPQGEKGDPQGASLHHIGGDHQMPKGTDDVFKIYKQCKRYVEKYNQFMPGSRHKFILKLALEVRKKGITEGTALFLIPQDYDLDLSEINKIVKDVYQFDLTQETCRDRSRPVPTNEDKPQNENQETKTDRSRPVPTNEKQQTITRMSKKLILVTEPVEVTSENQAIVTSTSSVTKLLGHHPTNEKHPQNKKPKPKSTATNLTDPEDDDEIIFPLMDELDEMYYAGGEPIPYPETPAQVKLSIKMNYSHRIVEMMLNKVLEFMYNIVNGRILWRRKGSVDLFQRVADHEENSIQRWLHLHDQIISISMLHNILTSNFSRYFNPFTDYFRNLKKVDPSIDYIGQLIATVRTEDDQYWSFCFRKWFVAFVMSLYRKKVINHTIIVFVGAQGCGKTSFFRTLNPVALREYLSPSATSADHKDTQIMLAECSLIIMDELESLNRRDLAAFKDLVTLEFVHVRRPYGRFAVNLPRYASIIASVNATQILTDPTGSRRYLCSTVKSIDYEHNVDIDACMAQALVLGKSGFKYWFDQEEIRELNYHNEAYMAKSIEEETIETWMQPVSVEEWNNRDNLSYGKNICLMKAADISVFLAGKTKQSLVANTNSLVGKILKKLNFLRQCKDSGYYFIVRIMTDEEVARNRRSLDDSESQEDFEQDLNRYNNPDRFIEGNRKEDELPF